MNIYKHAKKQIENDLAECGFENVFLRIFKYFPHNWLAVDSLPYLNVEVAFQFTRK